MLAGSVSFFLNNDLIEPYAVTIVKSTFTSNSNSRFEVSGHNNNFKKSSPGSNKILD